jgi:triosephosphate isomerase
MARRRLVAGNWKMNGLGGSVAELEAMMAEGDSVDAELVVCPPATLLAFFAQRTGKAAPALGGQTCHAAVSGAHTGDISAEMLADAGARYVIVGHSERRADHGETDAMVRAQAEAAWRAGLCPILCVGETEAERDAGDTLTVIEASLRGSVPAAADTKPLVIAYEPVWAIGTGRTPNVEQIDEVHRAIRATLAELAGPAGSDIRVLYGGSVKPDNAAAVFSVEDVDGALVGGASLKAADFIAIAKA